MQTESSIVDPLHILNQLRKLENRKELSTLPPPYKNLYEERLRAQVNDWIKQIEIHKELKEKSVEYNNRLILNETEQSLYTKNKRNPDNPAQFLKYNQVAVNDRDLYFPLGLTDPEEFVFVTDTNATYIQTLTLTTVNDKNICLAKHSIPDCISFVPGAAELTPKQTRKPREQPDPSLIVESRLRSKTVKQPAKVPPTVTKPKEPITPAGINATVVIQKRPDIKTFINAQRQKLLDNKEEVSYKELNPTQPEEKPDSEKPIPDKSQELGAISPASSHSSLSSVKSSVQKVIKSPFKIIKDRIVNIRSRKMPREIESDIEVMQIIETKVSELINKHMEETFATGGRRRQPSTPPNKPEGDQNDIISLQREVESLRAQQQMPRQTFTSEKEAIVEIKQNMAEMAHYIQKLHSVIEENKLMPEEKQKLKLMSGPTTSFVNPLVYKLNYPSNIIGERAIRGPLSILKAPSVVATIGVFDPETNPKADFRETWERIQNYTRNYDLYEHEYVDMLMVLMKGSAATCLTDMIREYEGNLSKILEAIQDIYVPQHTIFDDVDELNKFSRPAQENIKTTMRRATLVINKLKSQCAPAAWNDRRYHMLLALIKQVIERDTFRHLYAKELECAQIGTQLDILAVVNIIALHEQTHDLIPKREMRLQYNINSMQVINHKDDKCRPVKTMTVSEKKDKKHQPSKMITRSHSRELIKTPSDPRHQRGRSNDRNRSQNHNYERKEMNERPRYRSSSVSSSSGQNYSQRNSQGQRDYRTTSPYSPDSRSQSYDRSQPVNRDRARSSSRDRSYRPHNGQKDKRYEKPQIKPNVDNKDRNKIGNPNNNPSKYQKSFKHGTNLVTLHFYKCQTCPSMHPTGSDCDKKSEITSLNM